MAFESEAQHDTIPKGDLVPSYGFRPFLEALVIGIAVFAAISLTTTFIYKYTLDALKGEIREGLARTASVIAPSINGDLHRQFHSREQETSPEYARALVPLSNALRTDKSIAYVYTVVLRDGKVYFVLDPTPPGILNDDGLEEKSHIMQEYADAPAELLLAIRRQKTVTSKEPYQDAWGSFMSGFAPFYDSTGRFVGIVAVEIKADNYYARLEPVKRATVRAVVTGFFTAFTIASLVWFMRNFSRVINSSRSQIYADLIEARKTNSESRHDN
ncbi:MAG: chemotaxis protein [Chlorobiaceae bacterium]|nr:chemotaxis protein [Chlorobiaceae bacterium]